MSEQANPLPQVALWGGLGLLYALLIRPSLLSWGTRSGEAAQHLPGDDLIRYPTSQFTHAIDISAAPGAIFPWLSQMGRDRTGFYSLDPINNEGIPSANFLRQNLPALTVGTELDNGLRVLQVEAPGTLVYGGFNRISSVGVRYDVTLAYHLEQHSEKHSRLIVRQRFYAGGLPGTVYSWLCEPLDIVQSVAQLHNLRELAASTHMVQSTVG